MAKGVTVQIQGLKECHDTLDKMGAAFEIQYLKKALIAGIDIIVREAIRLLRSVTHRSDKNREGWAHVEDALVESLGRGSNVATAWAKVARNMAPQGLWLEYGHRIVGHRPNRKDTGKRVDPSPFFFQAVKNTRAEVRRTIKAEVQGIMKAVIPPSSEAKYPSGDV